MFSSAFACIESCMALVCFYLRRDCLIWDRRLELVLRLERGLFAFLGVIDLGLLVGSFKVVECPCVVNGIRLVLSATT